MDLRNLPPDLSSFDQISERKRLLEEELQVDLSCTTVNDACIGDANEKNCEQMFGAVPLPVGLAGPLQVELSSSERINVHLPLATTEGALVASINRGCKAVGCVRTSSERVGITRSIAWKKSDEGADYKSLITEHEATWKKVGEETSKHLKVLSTEIDETDDHIFLTIAADTDEAMGMNMVTIAAQAIGNWIADNVDGLELITIAANVDSDKKPSSRTHSKGRGFLVTAEADIPRDVIENVLKTTPEKMLAVANAKLRDGSRIAGALGANLHAANTIAALYLATGQDAAHVAEGSLTDTTIELNGDTLKMTVRCPAILVGVRGGGTNLPAQKQCLDLLLKEESSLHPCAQLAETIGAAVLAGEVSLLAAQASQNLASAHSKLGR